MERIMIPSSVKEIAKKALMKRKSFSDKPGLNLKEAKKAKVRSGVQTANILIRSKTIGEERAKAIGRFYDRFKNCKTPRCEVAIDLWGGRNFGKKMADKF